MDSQLNLILFGYAVFMALIMQASYNHMGKGYKSAKDKRIEVSMGFRIYYLALRIVYIPALYLSLFRGIASWEVPAGMVVAGQIISIVSSAIFVYSKLTLAENYSPCYDSYVPRSLTQSGIYKYIRHPIYSSNILNIFSVFMFTGSYILLGAAIILVIYYVRSAMREEQALGKAFPEYLAYKKRAGMFLPNVFSLIVYRRSLLGR